MCKHFFENLASAFVPGYGEKQAADAQTKATEYGINKENEIFDYNKANIAPWMGGGLNAFNAYNSALGLGGGYNPVAGFGGTNAAPGGGSNAFAPLNYANQSHRGNTPIQDIQAGVTAGNPISDASYMSAGFGAGGAGLGGGPSYQDYVSGAYTGAPAQGAPSVGGTPGGTPAPYGGFQQSPGYQFAYDQGMRGVNNAFAARGGLNSGARIKATERYGQGIADQEFNNYLSQLLNSAQFGYNALNLNTQTASGYANDFANLWQNKGAAQASRYAGIANAFTDFRGPSVAKLFGGGQASSFGGGGGQPTTFSDDYGNVYPI